MLQLLLDKGADFKQANIDGQKPVDVAKDQKIKDMLISIEEENQQQQHQQQQDQVPSNVHAAPKMVDESQWFQAAKDGNLAVIQQGINDKIDVNCQDSEQSRTALYWAVQNGHSLLVDYLIDQHADLSISTVCYLPSSIIYLSIPTLTSRTYSITYTTYPHPTNMFPPSLCYMTTPPYRSQV